VGSNPTPSASLIPFRSRADRTLAHSLAELAYQAEVAEWTGADTGVPLVYDVPHHRCLPDGLSVAEATERARKTWKTEPLFHISSPLEGWAGPKPERHHDYITPADFPREWLGWRLTVEVEAKAKELAVARLLAEVGSRMSADRGRTGFMSFRSACQGGSFGTFGEYE
jgi:UV DNA damage repair endonuclease